MKWKRILLVCLITIITLPAVRFLAADGFFPMHDDTQVARVIAMGKALREGQFPVRIVPDLGYGFGYPLFNFYGPLPYYSGGILYALGLPALSAAKIMIGLGLVLSGVIMYLSLAGIIGNVPAAAAAVIFVYLPYHAVQVFVRGAVGELWAMAFLPLAFNVFLIPRDKPGIVAAVISGIGLSGVILSHTVLGYFSAVIYAILTAVTAFRGIIIRDGRQAGRLVISLVAGLGLSAFFWLPAAVELPFTRVFGGLWDKTDYRQHFVCLSQLYNSPWGFAGSAPGCMDGMSFMLGKLHLLLAVIAVIAYLFQRYDGRRGASAVLKTGIFVTLVSVFLMLPQSAGIWKLVPKADFIQYPWRLLTYAGFGLALVGGSLVGIFTSRKTATIILLVISAAAILYGGRRFVPQYLYQKPAAVWESPEELRLRVSKVSDEYLPADFRPPDDLSGTAGPLIRQNESLTVEYLRDTATYAKMQVVAGVAQTVRLDKAFFPGWTYRIDGRPAAAVTENSLPYLTIPAGAHSVELEFTDTPVRTISNIITVAAAVLILATLKYGKSHFR